MSQVIITRNHELLRRRHGELPDAGLKAAIAMVPGSSSISSISSSSESGSEPSSPRTERLVSQRSMQPDVVNLALVLGRRKVAAPPLVVRALSDVRGERRLKNLRVLDDSSRVGALRVLEFPSGGLADATVREQRRTFVLIYSAYVALLIARKNYGFWLPHACTVLELDGAQVAVVGSAFEIASGYGALLNGFLVDAFDPALGLAAALGVSALVNLALSRSTSLEMMAGLWSINGVAQSFGWPCVSRLFLRAFPDPRGRGLWYSLLSTSQNVGAALVPILVTSIVAKTGEPRAAFWLPAAVTAVLALVAFYGLRAQPPTGGGLRPVAAAPAPAPPAERVPVRVRCKAGLGPVFDVIGNWRLWAMAADYFCIGVIRSSLTDWSPIFLMEEKGMDVAAASRCLCAFELGGFLGSIGAGRLSDHAFQGRRGPVIAGCTALLCPALLALTQLSAEQALLPLYFALGALAFPVHVLLGLASREVVSPAASSTAGGLVKFVAQMGSSSAGYPLGVLQRAHGWKAVLSLLAAFAALGGALASTLWWTAALVYARTPPPRDGQQPHKRKGG
ncbi:major facilitator superfamily domain-containing protein [Pavlovales sp. CCMP2436]|nr:major facilitator superfamily domain-containing protein [Pavlovales sp. CCMP2436]